MDHLRAAGDEQKTVEVCRIPPGFEVPLVKFGIKLRQPVLPFRQTDLAENPHFPVGNREKTPVWVEP